MQTRVIRIAGDHYQQLRAHLFPGDGCEAVVLALCGRLNTATTQALCVHKVLPVPYERCHSRTPLRVSWPTDFGRELYAQAMAKHMAILKIHSHPTNYEAFSQVDDTSDRDLFASLHGWTDDGHPHGSAVMLQSGAMFGRFVTSNLQFQPVDRIAIAGDDLHFFDTGASASALPTAQIRTAQAFGEKTVRLLASLSIGVVGCSGTGSWVIEQLSRLSVGKLVGVDPKLMGEKNQNRIINSRQEDVRAQRPKVHVLADAVRATGLVREVVPFYDSCFAPEVLRSLAACDVLFGCMDTYDGRDLVNRLATFYCVPCLDVGVRLDADGTGGVSTVCGSVHYLMPGGSSLLSRGVYTPENLRAAWLKRMHPEQFQEELEEGYIKGVQVDRPAVVSINGFCATLAINNFLARLHPFRISDNSEIRWQTFDLVNTALTSNPDGPPCKVLAKYVGRGDMEPLLDSVLSQ
jgi:hypothetical protein